MELFTKTLHFNDAVSCRGYTYFSESTCNALFRVKDGTGDGEFLGTFEREAAWQVDLHRQVFLEGNALYFVPLNGHGIHRYDLESGALSRIQVRPQDNAWAQFSRAFRMADDLFLVPLNLRTPFMRFHLKDHTYQEFPEILRQIQAILPAHTSFTTSSAVLRDSILYLAALDTSIVLKISLDSQKVEQKRVPGNLHFRNMSAIGDNFWFTAREPYILRWHEPTNAWEKLQVPHDEEDNFHFPYTQVIDFAGRLLVLPGQADGLWAYDAKAKRWEDWAKGLPPAFFRELVGVLMFLGYRVFDDGKLLLYPKAGSAALCLDRDGKNAQLRRIACDSAFEQQYITSRRNEMQFRIDRSWLTGESSLLSFPFYLFALKNKPQQAPAAATPAIGNIGKIVYDHVCEE